jgi:hypothetical protein
MPPAQDGALLDAASLAPDAEGWCIRYGEAGPRVEVGGFDGPGSASAATP